MAVIHVHASNLDGLYLAVELTLALAVFVLLCFVASEPPDPPAYA